MFKNKKENGYDRALYNLIYSLKQDTKVISVTSSRKGEGVTTVSTLLLKCVTPFHKRVLYIGFGPSKEYAKLLGFDKDTFIESKTLNNVKEFPSFEVNSSNVSVYTVHPKSVINPTSYKSFISNLKDKFDFVIVDSPSVLDSNNYLPVLQNSDTTVFVISALDSNKKDKEEAVAELKRNGINIHGSILNKAL